jgi:hypothetical protein
MKEESKDGKQYYELDLNKMSKENLQLLYEIGSQHIVDDRHTCIEYAIKFLVEDELQRLVKEK